MEEEGENFRQGSSAICPYCASRETEVFALFGQQLLTMQYYCNNCQTPFECVKDDDLLLQLRNGSADSSIKKGL